MSDENKKDKLEKVKRELEETSDLFETPELRWHFRRKKTPYTRWKIIERISLSKTPLNPEQIAYPLGLSVSHVQSNLRVLVNANVVCNRLEPSGSEHDFGPRTRFYSICPVCPLSQSCEFKARMVWKDEEEKKH